MSVAGESDTSSAAARELTHAADANVRGTHHVLPASAKVQLHELTSENAVLKARVKAMSQELKNARDVAERVQRTARGGTDALPRTTRSAHAQTKEVAGLLPLRQAYRTRSAGPSRTKGAATPKPDDADHHQQEAEMDGLRAELKRSNAECASLRIVVEQLKGSTAAPTRFTTSDVASPLPTDPSGSTPSAQVKQQMESLYEELHAANAHIQELQEEARVRARSGGYPAKPRASFADVGTMVSPAKAPLPSPSSSPPSSDRTQSSLEAMNAVLRAQLDEALEELRIAAQAKRSSSRGSATKTAAVAMHAFDSTAVQVDMLQPVEHVFRSQGLRLDVETVEDLLAVKTRHHEMVVKTRELEQKVLRDTHSTTIQLLENDLETVRRELTAAHTHIDELTYALEVEKRDKMSDNLASVRRGGGGVATGGVEDDDALKQANAEIAFLCDTLAATKAECETAHEQLRRVAKERDAATASFRELKGKTEVVLMECQSMAETSRSEAEATIANLRAQVRTRENDTASIRAQAQMAQREISKLSRELSTSQSECEAARRRVVTVQTAMSKLREDTMAQATQLREAKAQLAAVQAAETTQQFQAHPHQASPVRPSSVLPPWTPGGTGRTSPKRHRARTAVPSVSPRAGTSVTESAIREGGSQHHVVRERRARSASRTRSPTVMSAATPTEVSSIQALQRALDEREQEELAAEAPTDEQSPAPVDDDGHVAETTLDAKAAARSSRRTTTTKTKQRASPVKRNTAGDGSASGRQHSRSVDTSTSAVDIAALKEDYEEFRSCFLSLSTMAPNATTAREVTNALTTTIQSQKERCITIDKELRKRNAALQNTKKELNAAREQIVDLQRRSSHMEEVEQKLAAQSRVVEKHRRTIAMAADDKLHAEAGLRDHIATLEVELEKHKAALAQTKKELREGRSLMIALIGSDHEAFTSLSVTSSNATSEQA